MKFMAAVIALVGLTGCQIPYIANSGWQQAKLYSKRVDIDKVVQDKATPPETRRKLELVKEARRYAENELGLKSTGNYRQFVALDRPYVSYIVHAAPSFKLESHRWWFPLIGNVPYKGYFSKADAEAESKTFPPKDFDVFVRGVTAYSTLGWFDDPVWSSMMIYHDADLVNTVIHETVHATIFIKSQADFNERMATFLGDLGTEMFYRKKEGDTSKQIERLRQERIEQKLFSDFLSKEMKDLREWYKQNESLNAEEKIIRKTARLKEIQERFKAEIQPQIKSGSYSGFATEPLNNARLLAYGTYYEDLSDFEKLREKLGPEFKVLLAYLKNLSQSSDPESELKRFVSASP